MEKFTVRVVLLHRCSRIWSGGFGVSQRRFPGGSRDPWFVLSTRTGVDLESKYFLDPGFRRENGGGVGHVSPKITAFVVLRTAQPAREASKMLSIVDASIALKSSSL